MRNWRGLVAIVVGSLASCGGIVAPAPGDAGRAAAGSSSGGASGGSSGSVTSSGGSSSGAAGSSSASGGVSSGSSGGFEDASPGIDVTVPDDAGDASMAPCGVQPALHPTAPGALYCGSDGQAALVCPAGQQCCLGGPLGGGMYAPEQCTTWTADGAGCANTPVGNAIGIACNQVSDCAANGQEGTIACCLQGATAPAVPPGCPYFKSKGGTAIVCENNGLGGNGVGTCAAGEVQVCQSDADCPAGTQCIAGKWKIFQIGFCM